MTIVNLESGEVLDLAAVLLDLDGRIAAADAEIGRLKENLKTARRHREGLVSELRAVARGERRLPLGESAAGASV